MRRYFSFVILTFTLLYPPRETFAQILGKPKPGANSPREDLRKKLFADQIESSGCKAFRFTYRDGFKKHDPEVDRIIREISKNFQELNLSQLQTHFHPRLKIAKSAIAGVFANAERVYKQPFKVTVFRVWALNNVDDKKSELDCGDGITIHASYGYPLQMGVWLQIMGQKELGKIHFTLVPTNQPYTLKKGGHTIKIPRGSWKIGTFHVQQWTHLGKDFSSWASDAENELGLKHKVAAHIKYDIASKLAHGGPFMNIAIMEELESVRERCIKKEDLKKLIADWLKDWKILAVGSILARDGAGLIVRIEVPREYATKSVSPECYKIGRRLYEASWMQPLDAIRCSFVVSGEDPSKEGVLGGIYLSKDKLFGKNKPKEKSIFDFWKD